MQFHWWTFGLQTANFLVLVWLLRHFLYKPVLGAVDRRRAEIESSMAEAAAAKQAAASVQAEVDGERAHLAAEREQSLAQAREEAKAERQAVLERTQRDAAQLLAGARAQLERERHQAAIALRDGASELAVTMARQLLARATPSTGVQPFLDEALQELEALPNRERCRLLEGPMKIVSATRLSPAEEKWCRERLRQLAGGVEVDVELAQDERLLAGVELHLRDSILHHSWRDALADALRELTAHADAH